MTSFRPHQLAPTLETARVILACRDFTGGNVSHVGLRISADYTAKTLRNNGIWAEAWSVKTPADLVARLRSVYQTAIAQSEVRPSHVIISAPWIPSVLIQSMAEEFPDVCFAVISHSNVGFLSADPSAIKILRECVELQMGLHNVMVGGNSVKFVEWATESWGVNAVWAPNLYDMSEVFVTRDRSWRQGSLLRVGIFGANRPLKNHISGVAAVVEIATRLGTPVELYMSSGRNEGGSVKAIEEMTNGIPNLTMKQTGWLDWPKFRQLIRTMDLLVQVSFTESFNVVTADGIAEGVPTVCSDAIDWVPHWWQAVSDEPQDIARVALQLLSDPTTANAGRKALTKYVRDGVEGWKSFLLSKR